MPPVISIVGNSDSGKTTLIAKLIPELKKKGYRVGIIKHAFHGFDVDREDKDSFQHMRAGADAVMLSSKDKIAMIKNETADSPAALEKYFPDMDLVITEGFKRTETPKIEVIRSDNHKEPVCLDHKSLIAVVTDIDIDLNVPRFGLESIIELTDYIEKKIL
ncbi:MAG: molybdopterin-guanine dinucleotide biosynthesis protein B [Desulfobacterales bacterium]|nr:molybdopterin-guanine dinucleotide biosynthesis protein B [Desulfobacterales bacterium]